MHRSGDGTWRKFPFWYTILALSEMAFTESLEELTSAPPIRKRTSKRAPSTGPYSVRRYEFAKRVLAKT